MASDHPEAFKKGQSVFLIHPTENWVRGTVTDSVHTKNKAGGIDLSYNCTVTQEATMLPTITPQNAVITGLTEDKLHVIFDSTHHGEEDDVLEETSKTNSSYFCADGRDTFNDLLDLSYLHDSTLLEQIRKRYFADLIYTRIGPIILALNPYNYNLPNYVDSRMPIYIAEGPEIVDNAGKSPLIPHPWHTAHYTYWLLSRGEGNQSIIVSGESGAGKTETAKIVVKYLGEVSTAQCSEKQRETAIELTRRVNKTSPILEAFGNAKTSRNDNSSRFGKFMKVHFLVGEAARKALEEEGGVLGDISHLPQGHRGGDMVGVSITVYLLEKSRIVTHGKGERGYHSFYQLLARHHKNKNEAKDNLLSKLQLKSAKNYTNLNIGNAIDIPGVDDSADYDEVIDSMESIGIGKEEQEEVWSVIGAVIHLLAIQISALSADECTVEGSREVQGVVIEGRSRTVSINSFRDPPCAGRAQANKDHIAILEQLLGIDMQLFIKELITTTSVMRGETIVKKLKKAFSIDIRDAIAKFLYESLFLWLVGKINDLISPPDDAKDTWIALLDIFGFENFSHGNSFEQLCINLANETLQNHYNSVVFTRDIEECHKEGINTESVKFYDNQPCLDLISGVNFSMCGLSSSQSISTTKVNIYALLDEECSLGNGTDRTFCHKIIELFGKAKNSHVNFKFPKTENNAFIIVHYAGEVKYTVDGFRGKNSDTTKDTLRVMLVESSNKFIRHVVENANPGKSTDLVSPKKKTGSAETVSTIFKNQLVQLMSEINCTTPHWIRCVKPHSAKKPRMFNGDETMTQMRSAGVLETVRIRQQSFSVRILFQQFITGPCGLLLKTLPRHTITTMERRAAALKEKAEAKRVEKDAYLQSRKESTATIAKEKDFNVRIERYMKQAENILLIVAAMQKKIDSSATLPEKCSIILQRSGVNESSLSQVGKTKVFLRSEAFQQIHQIEHEVREAVSHLPVAMGQGYISSHRVRCLQINKGIIMLQAALRGRFSDYTVKKHQCMEHGRILVAKFRYLLLLESEEFNVRSGILIPEEEAALAALIIEGQKSRDEALDRFACRMIHIYEEERQNMIAEELEVRAADLVNEEEIEWNLLGKLSTIFDDECYERKIIEDEMKVTYSGCLCVDYEKIQHALILHKEMLTQKKRQDLMDVEAYRRNVNEKEEYTSRMLLVYENNFLTDEMDCHDFIEMEEEEEWELMIIKGAEKNWLSTLQRYNEAKALSDANAIQDISTEEIHMRTLIDVEWEQGLISFYIEESREKNKSLQIEAARVLKENAEAVRREMARLTRERTEYEKWVEEEREFAKLIWLAAEKVDIERKQEEQKKVNAKLERLREAKAIRDRIQVCKLKEASSNKATNRSGGLARALVNMTDINNGASITSHLFRRANERQHSRPTTDPVEGSAADRFAQMMQHIDEIRNCEDLTPRTKRNLKMNIASGNFTYVPRRVSEGSSPSGHIDGECTSIDMSSSTGSPFPAKDTNERQIQTSVYGNTLVSTNIPNGRRLHPAELAFDMGDSPLGRLKYRKLSGAREPSRSSITGYDSVQFKGDCYSSVSSSRVFAELGVPFDEKVSHNPFDKYWRPVEGGRKVYLPNGSQVEV